jgi:hypothetical protein
MLFEAGLPEDLARVADWARTGAAPA